MASEKITLEAGKTYRNKGGSRFRCMSVNRDGSAVVCNIESGWTCIAHNTAQFPTGEIEWGHSTNGRFDTGAHLQAQIDMLDDLHNIISCAAMECPCVSAEGMEMIQTLLGKLHAERWAKMWQRAAEGERS